MNNRIDVGFFEPIYKEGYEWHNFSEGLFFWEGISDKLFHSRQFCWLSESNKTGKIKTKIKPYDATHKREIPPFIATIVKILLVCALIPSVISLLGKYRERKNISAFRLAQTSDRVASTQKETKFVSSPIIEEVDDEDNENETELSDQSGGLHIPPIHGPIIEEPDDDKNEDLRNLEAFGLNPGEGFQRYPSTNSGTANQSRVVISCYQNTKSTVNGKVVHSENKNYHYDSANPHSNGSSSPKEIRKKLR